MNSPATTTSFIASSFKPVETLLFSLSKHFFTKMVFMQKLAKSVFVFSFVAPSRSREVKF